MGRHPLVARLLALRPTLTLLPLPGITETPSTVPSGYPLSETNVCLAYQFPSRRVLIFSPVDRPLDSDALFLLLRQSIRRILTREAEVPVKHSYENIYVACRALVTLYNKGEGIYGNLKIDLEQSLGRLADHLETFQAEGPEASDAPGMKWIEEFVKVCRWFEAQIVRPRLRLLCRC